MHIWTRLFRINTALWGYLAWLLLVRLGVLRPRQSPAERLARVLEGLGTTFVKLGQGLSLHRELLPDAYIVELERLQDNVQPFDAELARREVETSFGRPVDGLFASYEAQPFAAGSIAQVHRATMPDGRAVVVKIRRPGIRRMVEEDIRILGWFLWSIGLMVPALRRMRARQLLAELSRNLHKEIDFRQEALNILRFVKIFAGSDEVYVPAVVDGLYTEWVVVQEMSMGQRIDAPQFRADGPRLAQALVNAFLHQFFVAGFFHGDPHPGNLFVLPDGRICMHDFGLVGFLDRPMRLNLVGFMLACSQEDADWLLDVLIELRMVAGNLDRAELSTGLEDVIQDYARRPLSDWSLSEAFVRVTRAGHGHMRAPQQLLVFLRAIFLMESTLRALDPGFNLVERLFARGTELLERSGEERRGNFGRLQFEAVLLARNAPRGLGELAHGLRMALQSRPWEQRGRRAAGGADDVAGAILAAGLYLAAAWLLVAGVGPVLMGIPVLPAAGLAAAVALTLRTVNKRRS